MPEWDVETWILSCLFIRDVGIPALNKCAYRWKKTVSCYFVLYLEKKSSLL